MLTVVLTGKVAPCAEKQLRPLVAQAHQLFGLTAKYDGRDILHVLGRCACLRGR